MDEIEVTVTAEGIMSTPKLTEMHIKKLMEASQTLTGVHLTYAEIYEQVHFLIHKLMDTLELCADSTPEQFTLVFSIMLNGVFKALHHVNWTSVENIRAKEETVEEYSTLSRDEFRKRALGLRRGETFTANVLLSDIHDARTLITQTCTLAEHEGNILEGFILGGQHTLSPLLKINCN